MPTLIFPSEHEATLVANQLYSAKQYSNSVFHNDGRALTLIANLTTEYWVEYGACCRIEMPSIDYDSDNPCIWVACLAAYNEGILHGAWIDAARDVDKIREDIDFILSYSPIEGAEEWSIFDFMNFEDFKVSENPDLEDLAKLACFLKDNTDKAKLFANYCEYYSLDFALEGLEKTLERFNRTFYGEFKSEEDFVEYYWGELGIVAKAEAIGIASYYINWEAIARGLFINHFLSLDADRGICVFHRY